jgi:protein-arginine kinase activator protein McsA
LDNEYILRQFEEIEKKVEKLVDAYKSLEASNLGLTNKIKRLKEEFQSKVEAENNYAEEKALIRSKIDSLLIRLEDITGTE